MGLAPKSALRKKLNEIMDSYSIPNKIKVGASLSERMNFVRGIQMVLKSEDFAMPNNLTDEDACELSYLHRMTISARLRVLKSEEDKKLLKANLIESKRSSLQEKLETYGHHKNFPISPFYLERLTSDRLTCDLPMRIANTNFKSAPQIIIDCGYDSQTIQMKKALYFQFNQVHSFVRQSQTLMNITYSSVDHALRLPQPIINYSDSGLYNVSNEDFKSLADHDEIVYLSPHSSRIMTKMNPNATYVIGGLVDLHQNLPYSVARARKYKVKTLKLPLDLYFSWERGHKSLTIDQMVKILYALWETNSWYQALTFIPKRKALPTPALQHIKPRHMLYPTFSSFQHDFDAMPAKELSFNAKLKLKGNFSVKGAM